MEAKTGAAAVPARERSESLGASGEVKYKFRRGAQRTVQHIDAAHLKEGQRVFQALHANEFAGPPVRPYHNQLQQTQRGPQSPKAHAKADNQGGKESGEGAPFFVGSGGEVYDVYYRKCDDEVARRIKGGGQGGADVFRSFPQPGGYETYFDYEQALLDWKSEVESALGDLHLPDIVGRYYARPTVAAPIQELVEAYDENASAELKIEERTGRKEETDDDFSEDNPLSDRRLSVGSLNPRAIIRERDPWDANLLPPEPQPEFYKTFEEFEEALLRWAEACNASLSYIPPHAAQLEQLIPIQSQATADQARAARQFRDHSTHVSVLDELHESSALASQGELAGNPRTGLCHADFFSSGAVSVAEVRSKARERLDPRKEGGARRPVEKIAPPEQGSDEWQLCRDALDSWVQRLLINRIAIHKEHGSFNKPMLPVIHGTFPTHYKTPRPPGYRPVPLRRQDLTEQMVEDCYDCPEGINGKKVEFNIPLVSIEPLEFDKLHANEYRSEAFSAFAHCPAPSLGTAKQGDRMLLLANDSSVSNRGEAYRVDKLRELRREQGRNRYDHLNAWNFPMLPQQVHDKAKAELEEVLKAIPSGAKTMSLADIEAILQNSLYLDQFQDRLSEPVAHMKPSKESGLPRNLGEYISKSVDSSNFARLLQFYGSHANNLLFLAKLSLLVQDLISGNTGKNLVEALINGGGLKALGYLAYSISFFNDMPVEVYPYDTELIQLIFVACKSITLLGSFLDPAMETIFQSVFTYYYLDMIATTTQSKSFVFFSLGSTFLARQCESAVTKLQEALKSKPQCLNQLVEFLGHRSARVSSFFLFILLRLLHIAAKFPAIKEHFVTLDIVDKTRQLARSRFSHVQYGARLIFALLQTAPWAALFGEKYSGDKALFLRDLTNSPLLSSLFLDACLQSLLRLASNDGSDPNELACSFLWKDGHYFETLLQQVLGSDCSQQIPRTIETCSTLLARLSQAFAQLKLVDIPSPIRKDPGGRRYLFTFTEPRARQLLTFISSVSTAHPLGYAVKTNALLLLRNLVKAEGAFPTIVGIPEFLSKLVVFCKDANDFAFNRAAWGTFFTIIQRHTGVLEHLIEKGAITNFFDIISVVSGNLISHNAIHYIHKVFNLHGAESVRVEADMEPKRYGDKCLQSVEKDVRALCKFFSERKMFIKCQMISKRFVDNQDPSLNHPGAAFVELVRLYKIINDSSTCEKLKKDIFKNAEYQQSFLALIEKYGGVNERDSGLYGTVIGRPRADARLPSSPSKEHTARSFLSGELPRVESTGKKGAPKTPKTPKKGAPASSSPNAKAFQSEPLQLPSAKKEGCDSPKRKWFGIKKKVSANKEVRDREKGGTLE